MQTDLSTDISDTCYTNGITEHLVPNQTTGDSALTIKNGSTTCFSTAFNALGVYQGTSAITVKSASGATVASATLDPLTNAYKVTCTGAQQVVLDPSCSSAWPVVALMGSQCENGPCSP